MFLPHQNPKKEFFFNLVVLFAVLIFVRGYALIPSSSFLSEYHSLITALLLVYVPVFMSLKRRQRIQYCATMGRGLLLGFKWFVIVSLIIFPSAFLVNHFYQKVFFGLNYRDFLMNEWALVALTQVLLVSFPEEFFFRGFLQESLNQIFPAQKKVFGVPFGWSCVIISLIFAFSHSVISLHWWHGFIFFPSLVFAWLKEKTGTIWASVLFHAACNVFAWWVAGHYGR